MVRFIPVLAIILVSQSLEDLLESKKVTLRAEGALVVDVLAGIADQTGIAFELDPDVPDVELNGVAEDLPAGKALDLLLPSGGLRYEVRGDVVVVLVDPDAPPPPPPPPEVPDPEPPPPEEESPRVRATLLEETGRYDEALKTLAGCKEDEEVRFKMGRIYLLRGMYEEAEDRLSRNPDHLPSQVILGRTYLRYLGKDEEGRKVLSHVISEVTRMQARGDEVSAEDLEAAGEAHETLRQYQAATDYYQLAVKRDPERVRSYLLWADIYLHKHDELGASELVEKAMKIDPASPWGRVLRAWCYMVNGNLGIERYTLAHDEVVKALETNPNLPEALTFMADFASLEQDRESEEMWFRRVLEVNPRSVPARAYLAVKAIKEGVEPVAADQPALFYLEIGRRLGYEDGIPWVERAIQRDPEYGKAHEILGLKLMRTGRLREAEEALRQAQALDTNLFVRNNIYLLTLIGEEYIADRSDLFDIRVHQDEATVMIPYVRQILEEAQAALGDKYGFEPPDPILCEVYADHDSFSTRTWGLPQAPALGVCFGRVVAIDSPTARMAPAEEQPAIFSWGRTLWHEYAHVVTLQLSGMRIPRWLTEGISVYEESRARPYWTRKPQMMEAFFAILAQGKLPPILEINRSFIRPETPIHLLIAYFHASVICEFIEKEFGPGAIPDMVRGYGHRKKTPEILREILGVEPDEFDRRFLLYCQTWMESTAYRPPYGVDQVPVLRKAFQASPEDAAAATRYARSLADTGRLAEAEVVAARAVDLDPESGDAHAVQGTVWHHLKRGKAATGSLQRALDLGCDDRLRVLRLLAERAEKRKDLESLVDHLTAIHEIYPLDPRPSLQLAKMSVEAGNREVAIPHLKAAARDPFDVWSRVQLMEIYVDQQKDPETIAMGKEIIEIDPFRVQVHFDLAEAYRRSGLSLDALREYDAALALEHFDAGEIAGIQAEIYMDLEAPERARERAEWALREDKGNKRAQRVLDALEEKE